jgi:hypothetical protein
MTDIWIKCSERTLQTDALEAVVMADQVELDRLDRVVAEAMGLDLWPGSKQLSLVQMRSSNGEVVTTRMFSPARDVNDTMEVVDWLWRTHGYLVSLTWYPADHLVGEVRTIECEIQTNAVEVVSRWEADTPGVAVCRAVEQMVVQGERT